ncbi:MAG: hypothetical protein ABJA79_10555 [Parafilimonas sp.]
MQEEFELLVDYNGHEYLFKATLNVYGYTHKIMVDVNGQPIIFEPDEERNYRAVLDYDDINNGKKFDIDLLKKIAESIEEILK